MLLQRCRIPSIVSDVRIERAATAETPEHELLGDVLEAQAASSMAAAEPGEIGMAAKPAISGSAANVVAQITLRVDATPTHAVINPSAQLITQTSLHNPTLTSSYPHHP